MKFLIFFIVSVFTSLLLLLIGVASDFEVLICTLIIFSSHVVVSLIEKKRSMYKGNNKGMFD